jgi:hypothetical protein
MMVGRASGRRGDEKRTRQLRSRRQSYTIGQDQERQGAADDTEPGSGPLIHYGHREQGEWCERVPGIKDRPKEDEGRKGEARTGDRLPDGLVRASRGPPEQHQHDANQCHEAGATGHHNRGIEPAAYTEGAQ